MATAQAVGAPKSITETVRTKWGWFLAFGLLLVIGGTLAILLPVASTLATSIFLGVILAVAGIFQIVHAFQVATWRGFFWELLVGVVQLGGGALIYFNPFAGAIALTLLIAATFAAQGVVQTVLALRVRPHDGWGWLLASGLVALIVAAMLIMKFPAVSLTAPGILAGISILFSGWAYIMIALAAKRFTA